MALSVWESLEAVFGYAYGGWHAEALRHRKDWARVGTEEPGLHPGRNTRNGGVRAPVGVNGCSRNAAVSERRRTESGHRL